MTPSAFEEQRARCRQRKWFVNKRVTEEARRGDAPTAHCEVRHSAAFSYEPEWDGFRSIVFLDGDEVVDPAGVIGQAA